MKHQQIKPDIHLFWLYNDYTYYQLYMAFDSEMWNYWISLQM